MNLGSTLGEELLSVGILLLIAYGYISSTVRTVKAWSSGQFFPRAFASGFLSEIMGPIDVLWTIGAPVFIAFFIIGSYRSGETIEWNHGNPTLMSVEEAACRDAGGTFEFEVGDVIDGQGGRFAERTLYCRMPNKTETRYVAQGRDIMEVTPDVDLSQDDR